MSEIFYREMVQIVDENMDWETAIRLGSIPMITGGYIEERYIKAMIDLTKKLGPFIDFGNGVAVPHARPDDGALKTGLSVLVNKKDVYLMDDKNHPIKVFIILSASDDKNHLETLSSLVEFLRVDSNMKRLKDCDTVDDVYNLGVEFLDTLK